jgi:hypothetical protein
MGELSLVHSDYEFHLFICLVLLVIGAVFMLLVFLLHLFLDCSMLPTEYGIVANIYGESSLVEGE